jgi:cytochrome P450 / NADPH-cytochrome P450 reductase
MILQNFNLRFEDSSYQLTIKQTLTLKPRDLFMRATLRQGLDPISLEKNLFGGLASQEHKKHQQLDVKVPEISAGKPMSIFYGSNSGTCEGLAQSLAGAANAHGYQATAKPLDMAADDFPKEQAVIIISASYEGQPPDNAAHFVEWLKTVDSEKIKGARYAVFGCGHRTYLMSMARVGLTNHV